MIAFLLGGITGLMNASLTMNLEIHNTAFIPGHFHLIHRMCRGSLLRRNCLLADTVS